MGETPRRAAIVTSDDVLSRVALGPVFDAIASGVGPPAFEVACVLNSALTPVAKRRLARRAIGRGALLYLAYMALEARAVRRMLGADRAPLAPVGPRCEALGIPHARFPDINAGAAAEFIRGHGCDLVIAVRPSQIFRTRFIDACPTILNFHCTRLPRYRGLAGVFHTLREGTEDLAVTLHEVPDERVDAGPILIQQRAPEADPATPLAEHHLRLFRACGELLATLPGFPEPTPQDETEATRCTWPTNREVLDYRRRGGRFLRPRA